ncbi:MULTISPECIES: hypothetical protein [Proteus]|uniref:hypothetical protein n=1 Tax=Proteus TaxID=583 RepID=UPI00130016CF|nr:MULTISPECIES: hypothetical protein [Proteus]MCE9841324.1 hypothetical protein [Proteus terrae]NBN71841.1 hypothetical protein [Proteus sp. G2618]
MILSMVIPTIFLFSSESPLNNHSLVMFLIIISFLCIQFIVLVTLVILWIIC